MNATITCIGNSFTALRTAVLHQINPSTDTSLCGISVLDIKL
ncbi:hypothetical protein JSMCR1_p547 (plasmid) [Escherichia coli]|nr:hypothetical protein JSMCR1_p547 [Escherichia coli]